MKNHPGIVTSYRSDPSLSFPDDDKKEETVTPEVIHETDPEHDPEILRLLRTIKLASLDDLTVQLRFTEITLNPK